MSFAACLLRYPLNPFWPYCNGVMSKDTLSVNINSFPQLVFHPVPLIANYGTVSGINVQIGGFSKIIKTVKRS